MRVAAAALALLGASCATAEAPAPPSSDLQATAATGLGDDYPGSPARRSHSGVSAQADGLTRELVEDLAAWDAADHADRLRAATSVATKYTNFRFERLARLTYGERTREIAVFRIHWLLYIEEFVLVPGWKTGGASPGVRVAPCLMSRRLFSRDSWARVLAPDAEPDRPDDAAHGFAWSDAARFCMRAHLELPTEAEWEHAVRAGESGGAPAADRLAAAWTEDRNRPAAPDETSGPVNGLGLRDIGVSWEPTESAEGGGFVARRGASVRAIVGLEAVRPDFALRPVFRLRAPYPYPAEDH